MKISVKVDREVYLDLQRNPSEVQKCLDEIAQNIAIDVQYDARQHMLDFGFSIDEADKLIMLFLPEDSEQYEFHVG